MNRNVYMLSASIALLVFATGPETVCAQQQLPAIERLFFTPQQRADMDRRRIANIPDTPTAEGNTVMLNGYVRRSGGSNTTWINGQPQSGHGAPRVEGNRVIISTDNAGSSTPLKVGQSLDKQNGVVQDMLESGQVRVAPAKGSAKGEAAPKQ